MRSASSHILPMSLLGFGLIGLALVALVQPESVTPPATLSDGSVSAVESLADYGTPSSERSVAEAPERVALPEGLRAAISSAIERDSYEIAWSAEQGEYQTLNRAQGLHISFSSKGIKVRPRNSGASVDWQLGMSLSGVGYGDRTQSVFDGSLSASGNRIDYGRVTGNGTAFTEWYVNTPRGLEQGFTLPIRPARNAKKGDPLVLKFEMSGDLKPSLSRMAARLRSPDLTACVPFATASCTLSMPLAVSSRHEWKCGMGVLRLSWTTQEPTTQ